MKKVILSAAIAFGIFMASCQSQTATGNSKQINVTIPVEEFSKKLSELQDVQLVDVRTPEEYQEGHLKNSINYNLNGSDFENQLNKLDKSKPVMVYCLAGGRSAEAAEMMKEKGFTQVYNMQGGIIKWNAANMPLDNGSSTVATTEKKGMSLEEFNEQVQSDKYVIVDFNAKWCKPCKKIVPMLESLSEKKKDKLVLLKVDADENKELLKEKNISAIPYLELYKDGKLVWKHEGDIDEATLLKETNL